MLTASLLLAAAALVCEALFGYPQALYRAIGHPVSWIGALIRALDNALNREGASFRTRKLAGCWALGLLLAVTGGVALALQWALTGWLGFALLVLFAASLPAQRSLHEHVAAVAQALEAQGLEGGRRAVSMIVGRNVSVLDEAGVARAAIESLAENFSDGVVAPLFWMALGGLPGGVLYKAANTADSMAQTRASILSNLIPVINAVPAVQMQRAQAGFSTAQSALPNYGLSGTQTVGLDLQRIADNNKTLTAVGAQQAQQQLAQYGFYSSAIGAAGSVAGNYLGGGSGVVNATGAGGGVGNMINNSGTTNMPSTGYS